MAFFDMYLKVTPLYNLFESTSTNIQLISQLVYHFNLNLLTGISSKAGSILLPNHKFLNNLMNPRFS